MVKHKRENPGSRTAGVATKIEGAGRRGAAQRRARPVPAFLLCNPAREHPPVCDGRGKDRSRHAHAMGTKGLNTNASPSQTCNWASGNRNGLPAATDCEMGETPNSVCTRYRYLASPSTDSLVCSGLSCCWEAQVAKQLSHL